MYFDKSGESTNKMVPWEDNIELKKNQKKHKMVSVNSIEIRGLEVLCVFEAKPCDCAEEQTRANDHHYREHVDID